MSGLPSLEVNGDCAKNPPQDGGGNCRLVWKNPDSDQQDTDADADNDVETPDLNDLPPLEAGRFSFANGYQSVNGSPGEFSGMVITNVLSWKDGKPVRKPWQRTGWENYDFTALESENATMTIQTNNGTFKIDIDGDTYENSTSPALPVGDVKYQSNDVYYKVPSSEGFVKNGNVDVTANFDRHNVNVLISTDAFVVRADGMGIDLTYGTFHSPNGAERLSYTLDPSKYALDENGNCLACLDGKTGLPETHPQEHVHGGTASIVNVSGGFFGPGDAVAAGFRLPSTANTGSDQTVGMFVADKSNGTTETQ